MLTEMDEAILNKIVCDASLILGPKPSDIREGGRVREFVKARHIVIYAIISSGKYSRKTLGEYFQKNPMTVTNSLRAVDKLIDAKTPETQEVVTNIKKISKVIEEATTTHDVCETVTIAPPKQEDAQSQLLAIADKLVIKVEDSKNQILDRVTTLAENSKLQAIQQLTQSLERHEQYFKLLLKQAEPTKKPIPSTTEADLRQLLAQIRLASGSRPDQIKPIEVKGPSIKGSVGKRSLGYIDAMTVPIYRCPIRSQDEDLMDKYGAWVSGYWVVRTNLYDQNWSISLKSVLSMEKDNAAFVFIEPK